MEKRLNDWMVQTERFKAGGEIKDISILRSSNSMFNNAALNAVAQYHCVGQGHDARVQVPFAFRIEG